MSINQEVQEMPETFSITVQLDAVSHYLHEKVAIQSSLYHHPDVAPGEPCPICLADAWGLIRMIRNYGWLREDA